MSLLFSWFFTDEMPIGFADSAVTIGKFDGVHLGHQALLAETKKLAQENALAAVAVTFDRHPATLLNPQSARPTLIGTQQKLDLFEELGMDASLVLQFDSNLANLSAEDFIDQVLVQKLRAQVVVVGEDFRFGANQSGDVESLKVAGIVKGFHVRVVKPVVLDGLTISSTVIRNLLDEGNVELASKMLGRFHSTRGLVEHGLKLGRQLGFPTANLARNSEGYLPLDGVYAGWLYCEGEKYPAALSVGINETLQEVPRLVEAHVLDRKDLDLYDKIVTIEYVQFLRPAAKFSGMEELIEAISADCAEIKVILNAQ